MKLKKILLILIVIALISLIIVGALLIYSINEQENGFTPATEDIPVEIDKKLKKVDITNDYYAVKTCVQKFYLYLAQTEASDYLIIDEEVEQTLATTNEKRKQAVYSMLDDKYIQYREINIDNVFEKVEEIAQSDVIIEDMYVSNQNENISVYLVYGKLRNQTTRENTNFNIIVEIDMLNRSFKILLSDYINEEIDQINIGQELTINVGSYIEKNDYNIFEYEIISKETYIIDMFNEFRLNMMYDYETAYEILNEEYKEKRFGTYEAFESYAKDNIRNSVIMQLSQYQINNYDDYTQYICVDQNGKYYIFNEIGIMDYTVILDTYTIDLPQFIEEYNNATDAEKAQLNIQKVFRAINDGDYNYVYNKLDPTFKQNNFPTLESFTAYITSNLYENNSIGYSNYQTNGNLHIYDINITNTDNENSAEITKNFIVQLLEGTDFVMSFSV